MQLIFGHELGEEDTGLFAGVHGDAAVSVPTFFESFNENRQYNYMFKGSVDLVKGYSFGAGYALNNGSDQVNGPTPVEDVFLMGLLRGDNENYNFPSGGVGSNQTHSFLVPGVEVDVLHIDGQYKGTSFPLTVRAWYGRAEDDFSFTDSTGSRVTRANAVNISKLESEMSFYGSTVAIDIIPKRLYVAGRYVHVSNVSPSHGPDNELERIQAAAGVWVNDRSLVKIEYVRQDEGVDSPGQIGSDWDGVLVEWSITF